MTNTSKLLAYFNAVTGDCEALVDSSESHTLSEGLQSSGQWLAKVDHTTDLENQFYTTYLNGNNLVSTRPRKPSEHHKFINGAWVIDIDSYKKEKSSLFKLALYSFITIDSDFPEWKQVNYADTYSELSIKKLTTSVTVTEQSTLDNIIAVRAWKNVLLTERDRVKLAIDASTDIAGVRAAVDSFTYTQPPIVL